MYEGELNYTYMKIFCLFLSTYIFWLKRSEYMKKYFIYTDINTKLNVLLKLKYSWNIQRYFSDFSNLIS